MLRKYNVEPVLVAGYEDRGGAAGSGAAGEFPTRPDGALRHWTAGPTRGATPSLNTVTFGRPDLRYMLAQVLQSREPPDQDDKAYVIGTGWAAHAGNGELNGIRGNRLLLANEIEWSGPREFFSSRRKDVSERIMAALLDCCTGDNNDDVGEHREYARPAGRKIDTNLSGDELRARMRVLRGAVALVKPPTFAPVAGDEEDEEMNLPGKIVKGDATGLAGAHWYVTDGVTRQWINGREHAAVLISIGAATPAKGTGDQTKTAEIVPHVWPQKAVDSIRLVGAKP